MQIRRIQKSFIASRLLLTLFVLVFLALRLLWKSNGHPLELWGSALIQTGIALFLWKFSQQHAIIRQRTLMPAFFYLLLVGANPLFVDNLRGNIISLLAIVCLALLFSSYHKPHSQGKMFNISLILMLGSFYWIPILLLFPLVWYGMIRFKIFNFKNFLSTITAAPTIAVFFVGWSVYTSDWTIFEQTLSNWIAACDFRYYSLGPQEWTILAFPLFLFLLSGIKLYIVGVSEKTQAMNFLSYLYLMTCILIGLFHIQSQWASEWLLLSCIPVSLLMAHYFTLAYKPAVLWLLLLTVAYFTVMFLILFLQRI
jgi:hypothetical protein